jgi:hypothetical protein
MPVLCVSSNVLYLGLWLQLAGGEARYGWVGLVWPKKCNRRDHAHRHRLQILYWTQKKWAPGSLTDRSSFLVFLTRFLYRERHHQSLAGGPKKRFLRVAPGVGQNCPGPFHDALDLFA